MADTKHISVEEYETMESIIQALIKWKEAHDAWILADSSSELEWEQDHIKRWAENLMLEHLATLTALREGNDG